VTGFSSVTFCIYRLPTDSLKTKYGAHMITDPSPSGSAEEYTTDVL
jgi:hypothetical protein